MPAPKEIALIRKNVAASIIPIRMMSVCKTLSDKSCLFEVRRRADGSHDVTYKTYKTLRNGTDKTSPDLFGQIAKFSAVTNDSRHGAHGEVGAQDARRASGPPLGGQGGGHLVRGGRGQQE